ncbi:ParB/RepB/Spo0J family partition protein [Boseongicola aestuarii]|uniref:Chromosome-partitioning protein ParB n=1 Tax=Boseongicola aestuarii TaxID=1470561 RepID=A0A238J2X6_9RHOB|nr:ParB/RepB/Spo0J family partition protein [Boseongicola aestuarii]SMX24977.1 Chromosome-partitioning protein ParB [Boseongicola aestuarii]
MAHAKQERRGLGRGLSALMADVDTTTPQPATGAARKAETFIAVDRISPNPNQPRRTFTEAALAELTSSLREKGVIQPLILRRDPSDSERFQIVAGERRWRAAQRAQLHEVPAIVRDLNDSEVLELAIIENIQRADLNAIEEAAGYRQLMDRFGHTQEKLAEALGKSRSHIANLLRLLTLPDSVMELVRAGDLSAGHARALVTADDPVRLAAQVVKQGLSVRQTEALAKKSGALKPTNINESPIKDADTRALELDLAAALGMKVTIAHPPGTEGGALTIRYNNLDQLDELCRKLSVTTDAGKV